ncbi:MAG: hypothetical protein JNL58_08330 [Planctomyces sp.]|nr:hypothetical protein [Planctomyces sp.]
MMNSIRVFLATSCWLISVLSQQVQADEIAKPAIVVTLGDSITKGVRTGVSSTETFSAILEHDLRQKGISAEVRNPGIGGERTDQALARLQKDVLALSPRLVVIMYGTNDSYVDPGNETSRITADQFEMNLTELTQQLRSAGVVVVLMTEPAWGKQAKPNGAGEHPNQRLEEYMKKTRATAKSEHIELIDHFQHWKEADMSGKDIGEWTTDQCHPNPEGHREIAGLMLPVIEKLLSDK